MGICKRVSMPRGCVVSSVLPCDNLQRACALLGGLFSPGAMAVLGGRSLGSQARMLGVWVPCTREAVLAL